MVDGSCRVDVDHPELVGQRDRLADRGHRARRAARDVLVDHLAEVHAVDVVGADHDDDVGLVVVHEVERLVDRVGAAEVPVLADPLLGRHRGDVVAQQGRHPPGGGDVAVEGVRLVLRQHDDAQVAAVDDVGQREVDEPVDARRTAPPVWPGRRSAASAACPPRRPGRWRGPACDWRGSCRHVTITPLVEEGAPRPSRNRGAAWFRDGAARLLNQQGGGSVPGCASTSSPRSTRPRSTAGRGSMWPSWSARCAACRTSTSGSRPSVSPATRPGWRRTPTCPSSRRPTPPCRPSASTSRSRPAARAPTSCTPTPGTPTSAATWPACSTASRTSSPPTRWSRCAPGRPSSSAAATPSRRSPSARRTSARAR